jgi:hypothetical protein
MREPIDLSKVDEVGFADLIPGSGHGAGGYVNVASFEVYGKPVKRRSFEIRSCWIQIDACLSVGRDSTFILDAASLAGSPSAASGGYA